MIFSSCFTLASQPFHSYKLMYTLVFFVYLKTIIFTLLNHVTWIRKCKGGSAFGMYYMA